MKKNVLGAVMATAVAGALIAVPVAQANDGKSHNCVNNSCHGKSACNGHGNDKGKGKNDCKGKGWIEAKDEKDCKAKGGKWEVEKPH